MESLDLTQGSYLFEYLAVLIFIIIALLVVIGALFVSYVIVPQRPYKNKNSAYESGMDTFEHGVKQVDIKFYLIAVLFIIFDIEILFMYPWALSLLHISNVGFISMLLFLFVLTIGFIYEWKKGALDW